MPSCTAGVYPRLRLAGVGSHGDTMRRIPDTSLSPVQNLTAGQQNTIGTQGWPERFVECDDLRVIHCLVVAGQDQEISHKPSVPVESFDGKARLLGATILNYLMGTLMGTVHN